MTASSCGPTDAASKPFTRTVNIPSHKSYFVAYAGTASSLLESLGVVRGELGGRKARSPGLASSLTTHR